MLGEGMAAMGTTWQPDGWGWRARIGLLTPHNDVVPEDEFGAMAPNGVAVHVARVTLGWRSGPEPPPIGLDAVRALASPPHVDEAAELVAATPISVIAYAFTSSSYLLGPEGDAALKRRLETRSRGIPIVLPCPAVILALRALGVSRLAIVHPPWFPPQLDQLGADYFRNQGCEVVYAAAAAGLPASQFSIEPAQVYEWVRTHVPENAEAVFLGGGGLRAIAAIQALEDTLARPVLSANQVLFWHALRLARVDEPIARYGRVFRCALPGAA
jgi:maleate isomerase